MLTAPPTGTYVGAIVVFPSAVIFTCEVGVTANTDAEAACKLIREPPPYCAVKSIDAEPVTSAPLSTSKFTNVEAFS